MTIRGAVRFDKAEQDGLSGKTLTPLGWEDADIVLVLELLTDKKSTCYDKLTDLEVIFKGYDNGGNPNVYEINNSHVDARGISKVVFSGLESSETDGDDLIVATLLFAETEPAIVEVEKPVIASDQATGTPAPATSADVESDPPIMVDM
jgi:hypothetical protein